METNTNNEPESNDAIPENAFLIVEGVKIHPLKESVINVGRRLENHVVIDDARISRTHVQLRVIKGHFVLFDLNSTGGTFVNGQRTSQTVLYPGDVISLAGVTLVFGQDIQRADLVETSPLGEAGSSARSTVTMEKSTVDVKAGGTESRTDGEASTLDWPDEVAFTAYHPKAGQVATWHTMLVYAHLMSALEKVREDAKRFAQEIESPRETTSTASTRIVRGTDITIAPYCEGITFNPERITLKWMEDFQRADFRFQADNSLSDDSAKGQITICVGPLIIGTLKFAMLFNDKDVPAGMDQEAQSKMYSKDRIFISYSHEDTEIALLFRNFVELTDYDSLIDIDDLRTGQIWNEELMRMIGRADIFQLFWSSNSSQSKYCQQEWEHALKQNRPEGYIRPVYWQKPFPKPPTELSKFHFTYVELKIPTADAS
jgi:pSer/pThr/pTyr-binding forkhead associated (FHA) protein